MQFCKGLLGVKSTTQNDFIHGELGRTDYKTMRLFCIIKYWLKIVNVSESKYINKTYKILVNDLVLRPNKRNWASLVKDSLSGLGFYEVWLTQGVGDVKLFLSLLKQRLKDTFIQNWYQRIQDSTRASFYRTFAAFEFQNYLETVDIKKFRTALTKLRLSSHRLEIEAGRWAKPQPVPRENRLCTVCNVLEDEHHFLVECSMFNEIRKQHIKKVLYQ